MTEKCNCDASCGENRYHELGSAGCKYQKENMDSWASAYNTLREQNKVEDKSKKELERLQQKCKEFEDIAHKAYREKEALKQALLEIKEMSSLVYEVTRTRLWEIWEVADKALEKVK